MKQKFWMILPSVLLLLVLIFLIRGRITPHSQPHPHAHSHDHSHDHAGPVLSPDEVLDLDGLERFHGHLGPYLVLGARAVQVGSSSLGVPTTQLNVVLSCNLQSPERCMVDAVQFYSDATFGRGRLAVLSALTPMMHVIDRQTGNTAILVLSPTASEILSRLPGYSGRGTSSDQAIADLAREAAQLPGKALWDVTVLKGLTNGRNL